MLLTSMLRFITIYLMIWPSLALYQSSKQEYHGDLTKSLELKSLHRPSQVDSPCICGFSSLKCCRRKRVLEKPTLTPLEIFDDRHTEDSKKRMQQDQVFENRVMSSACICGMTSVKCCRIRKKRLVPKADHGRSRLW